MRVLRCAMVATFFWTAISSANDNTPADLLHTENEKVAVKCFGKSAFQIYQRLSGEVFQVPGFNITLKIDKESGLICSLEGSAATCSFDVDNYMFDTYGFPFELTDRGIVINDTNSAEKLFRKLNAPKNVDACPTERGTSFVKGPIEIRVGTASSLICVKNSQTGTAKCRLDFGQKGWVIEDCDA